ncbi:DUF2125 domain-containing protein [Rhodobacteraceae bacterium]|nr:DUF2125 domain-containing protein [Paracoccaceae bacterium]
MARVPGVAFGVACLTLGGTASFADVTAQDVWTDSQALYRSMGYELSVKSEDMSGDTLTVTGIQLTQPLSTAEGIEGTTQTSMETLRFIEQGDGTVRVEVAAPIKGKSSTSLGDGSITEATNEITLSEDDIVASGAPGDVTYAIDIGKAVVDTTQTVREDKAEFPTKVTFNLDDISGSYHSTAQSGTAQSGTVTVAEITAKGSGSDPGGAGFDLDGTMKDLTSNWTMQMPEGMDRQSTFDFYTNKDVNASGDLSFGATTANIAVTAEDGDANIAYSSQSGKVNFGMDNGILTYGGLTENGEVKVRLPNLPMPLQASFDKSSGQLTMPIIAGEQAQAFGVQTELAGLTLSDQIWAMFDPTEQLPRDPADLRVDLSGHAILNQSLFSDAVMQGGMPSGELKDLKINALHLDAVGAELNGDGDLRFNSATGMAMPIGTINLALDGAKELMGKLTEMGLLPQDQAMFAQMILGLYAKPTGDDQLSSQIEFTEDGQILANGQRIQ